MSILPALHDRQYFSREALLERIRNQQAAITAPTGSPPRAWTQEERDACQVAMRRIVERERAMREDPSP